MKLTVSFGLTALLLVLNGCKNDDVETIEPDKPSQAFNGKPEERFCGKWKTEDGVCAYNLESSGSYKLETLVRVQGQKPMLAKSTGLWGLADAKMQFKDQAGNVATYSFDLNPNKLILTSLGSLKSKTIMDRVK